RCVTGLIQLVDHYHPILAKAKDEGVVAFEDADETVDLLSRLLGGFSPEILAEALRRSDAHRRRNWAPTYALPATRHDSFHDHLSISALNVNFPKPLRASRVGARALLLLVAVQGISACASGPRPENTVTRFLHAFNDKDMNVMLTCVDPRQERLFRGTFHLIERFTGFPVEDVLDVVPGLAQLVPQQQMDDVRFSDVRFVDRRVEAG